MSELIDSLKKSVESNPGDWESRLALIEACLKEGDRNGAVEALSGIEALPTDTPSLIAAAKCYALVGSPGAVTVIEPLVEAEPENAKAHLCLAQIAHQFNDTGKARKHYHEAVRLDASVKDEKMSAIYGDEEDKGVDPVFVETPDVDINEATGSVTLQAIPAGTSKIVIPPQTADLTELRKQEKLSELKSQRVRQREKVQALFITIIAHVGIILALGTAVLNVPQTKPPEIVASAAVNTDEDTIEKKTLTDPQPWKPPAASSAVTDVITSAANSAIAMPSFNENAPTDIMSLGNAMTPSMDFALPGEEQKMLFGQKIEGKVLGVILDVSGSMAEYLPKVIREVDKNFDKSPIVFVRHTRLQTMDTDDTDIWPIVAEDVVPNRDGRYTPYWFLWNDLPRKAEQDAVNKMIEIFKTRPNCFLGVGYTMRPGPGGTQSKVIHHRAAGKNNVARAVEFLISQKVDSVYIFSDFEDYVDEEVSLELGKILLRNKIKGYVQPAERGTEFLDVMTTRLVSRSQGRKLPPLVEVASRSDQEMAAKARQKKVEDVVRYATPRDERDTGEFYSKELDPKRFNVVGVYEHENFDVVMYGPEARAHIYLKSGGGYIQRPLWLWYWSGKYVEDERYGNRVHRRNFVKARNEPKFENNTITWEMLMEKGKFGVEKELEFDIELTIKDNQLVATYRAEMLDADSLDTHPAHIYFHISQLGAERNDLYYNYDFLEGLNLDQIREAAKVNKAVFNLPGQFEDQYGKIWDQYGYKRGYNEFTFDSLMRREPPGLRDVVVTGPSFGERKIDIATTSNRLLMSAEFHRNDIELWEGFGARLSRPGDRRERWTKTEAFRLTID